MEGISNNVQSRPSYKATKRVAAVGAGVGAIGAAATAVSISAAVRSMKGAKFGVRRAFVQGSKDGLEILGKDLSNTTLKKALKSSVMMKGLKTLAVWTAIGAGVGLAIDLYKNHKAKKAENV